MHAENKWSCPLTWHASTFSAPSMDIVFIVHISDARRCLLSNNRYMQEYRYKKPNMPTNSMLHPLLKTKTPRYATSIPLLSYISNKQDTSPPRTQTRKSIRTMSSATQPLKVHTFVTSVSPNLRRGHRSTKGIRASGE